MSMHSYTHALSSAGRRPSVNTGVLIGRSEPRPFTRAPWLSGMGGGPWAGTQRAAQLRQGQPWGRSSAHSKCGQSARRERPSQRADAPGCTWAGTCSSASDPRLVLPEPPEGYGTGGPADGPWGVPTLPPQHVSCHGLSRQDVSAQSGAAIVRRWAFLNSLKGLCPFSRTHLPPLFLCPQATVRESGPGTDPGGV